jgi:hypothetical protein
MTMQEMDGNRWKRKGCSIVWSSDLLEPLITEGEAVPLRVVLGWYRTGLPDNPPGDRNPILVGGLQTVLTVLPSTEARFQWLRQHILPLTKDVGNRWAAVGLVFAMDGPGKLFTHNEADDLVYFGRWSDRTEKVAITHAMWAGAATGEGTYQIVVPGTKDVGGYHVIKVS